MSSSRPSAGWDIEPSEFANFLGHKDAGFRDLTSDPFNGLSQLKNTYRVACLSQ